MSDQYRPYGRGNPPPASSAFDPITALLQRLFSPENRPKTDPVADAGASLADPLKRVAAFLGGTGTPEAGGMANPLPAPDWLKSLSGTTADVLKTIFVPFYGANKALNPPALPTREAVPPVPSSGNPVVRPIATRSTTSGPGLGGQAIASFPQQTLPAPPELPPPPARGQNPAIDFSRTEEWLNKSAPTPSGQLAAVLGGLSQVGPQREFAVAPTFSEVLASMGAGASKGFAESSRQGAEYARNRAGVSMDQTRLTHENDKENNKILYENAQRTYDTNIANKLAAYKHQLEVAGLNQPTVTSAPNGVIIRQPDAATGQNRISFHETKPAIAQSDRIAEIYKVLTGSPAGPGPELMQAQYMASMYNDNPVLGRAAMMQLAVSQVVNRGTGQAVFGNHYANAVETAKRELQQFNPGLLAKPDEYSRQMYQRVAAILQANQDIMAGTWLERATRQNIGAAMLLRSGQETVYDLDEQGQPRQPAATPPTN